MSYLKIKLGGIELDLYAGVTQQAMSTEAGRSDVRLSGGALIRMEHWTRKNVTITGTGWVSLGLSELDYSKPLLLELTQPRVMTSDSNVIPISGMVRTDSKPYGLAKVGARWVNVPASYADGVITLDEVQGATAYRAHYQPMMYVLCDEPPETVDDSFSWTITAREV